MASCAFVGILALLCLSAILPIVGILRSRSRASWPHKQALKYSKLNKQRDLDVASAVTEEEKTAVAEAFLETINAFDKLGIRLGEYGGIRRHDALTNVEVARNLLRQATHDLFFIGGGVVAAAVGGIWGLFASR